MISFPNSKINIGLQVTGKREDGFHNLQTVFYPVAIRDVLEIVEADTFSFTSSGIEIDNNQNNLCIKAYHLLKKDLPGLPAARIHLHKAIPAGAGLGGGSSDASFCLQLLNKKFSLALSKEQLLSYALQLGSDCPFFIINKPCIAYGRGEQLQEIETDLSAFRIVIIHPGIHIDTSLVFSRLAAYSVATDMKQLIAAPVKEWKNSIFNDLEKPVFKTWPVIKEIKNELYEQGAVYASMSGSGSSVFGIFEKGIQPVLNFPPDYFSRWL